MNARAVLGCRHFSSYSPAADLLLVQEAPTTRKGRLWGLVIMIARLVGYNSVYWLLRLSCADAAALSSSGFEEREARQGHTVSHWYAATIPRRNLLLPPGVTLVLTIIEPLH